MSAEPQVLNRSANPAVPGGGRKRRARAILRCQPYKLPPPNTRCGRMLKSTSILAICFAADLAFHRQFGMTLRCPMTNLIVARHGFTRRRLLSRRRGGRGRRARRTVAAPARRRAAPRRHPGQCPADADRDAGLRRRRAGRRRDGAQHHPGHHRQSASQRACSRRSIRPPSSRRSPISTPCRAFPTGARSTPRRWSPAA